MKRDFLYAIISLLMANVMMTSCNKEEALEELIEEPVAASTWIEPIHDRDASVDMVKSFMATNRSDLSLTELSSAYSLQLVYAKSGSQEGILYSFQPTNGRLYSVVDTEPAIRKQNVTEQLLEHYTLITDAGGLLQFTNESRTLVVSITDVSSAYFNVSYDFVSK